MSQGPSAVARVPLPQPYDLGWARWYLGAHTVPGLEAFEETPGGGVYARTLTLASGPALLSVRLAVESVEVGLEVGPEVGPGADRDRPAARDVDEDLHEALGTVRRLLDLDADPEAVDALLAEDPALAPSVAAAPGLRIVGAVDGWELLVRTMVGQQISLAAARTHLGRLVTALGRPVGGWARGPGPDGGVWRLFPTPAAVAADGPGVLGGPRRRVAAVVSAAAVVADGGLDLTPGGDPAALRAALLALPGVGPWTADYVTLRLTPQRDVLLTGDLVVQQGARLVGLGPADLTDPGRWAPYRSYATMHLWRTALEARAAAAASRPARPARPPRPARPARPA